VDESIKQYLRRIGSKGGKALAENPQAKAKAAAKAAKAIAGTTRAPENRFGYRKTSVDPIGQLVGLGQIFVGKVPR
jgi:hypothetical protein